MAERGAVDLDDLVAEGYWLAAKDAAQRVLGVHPQAPERKLRKALANYSPTPAVHDSVASTLSLVQAHVRDAARARGVRVLDALNRLSREEWDEVEESSWQHWPGWFVGHYPQLRLDPDQLLGRTLLVALVHEQSDLGRRRTTLASYVAKARAGEAQPFAVVYVERVLRRYGSLVAFLSVCQAVLAGDPKVRQVSAQMESGMAEVEAMVEELRGHFEEFGIPHEHVIGPREE
jgi:hypothetical protein